MRLLQTVLAPLFCLLLATMAITAQGQTYETLFTDNVAANPRAGLVQGSDGAFYGTTYEGGASNAGTVFKVTAQGALTTLVSFDGSNGSRPQAGLVKGSDGAFYGTAQQGGAIGYGTVFKVTEQGTLSTLASFNSTNGSSPMAGLVKGSDGAFYGTTYVGGANNLGTVFKMTEAGVLTTLASFKGTNGIIPMAGLVKGSDGAFYGTTRGGGASEYGTVFKVTEEGVLTTLVSFNSTTGHYPEAGLVEGSDGAFYGTTIFGGASGVGTVFKVTAEGVLTTLVSFDGTNGSVPVAGLVEGSNGAFYGTTVNGGASKSGTVFEVTKQGTLTTLHSFDGITAGSPHGTPVFGSDGKLYGTARPMAIWRINLNSAPAVTTNAADPISATAATLHARVTPNGATTSVWFEYGTSTAYGSTTAVQNIGGGTTPVDVSQALTLQPHTTYYFRAVAQNSEGTTNGEGQSFTTLNRLPVAMDDTPSGAFGQALTIPVLANDTDADGDTLSLVSFTQPAHGTVAVSGSNANVLVYTPEDGFSGTDSFSYTMSDGRSAPVSGTVTITIAPQINVLHTKNTPVPGAGMEGSGVPTGAIWSSFGVPAINDAGQVAFLGKWRSLAGSAAAIFVDERQVVKKGDPVPGYASLAFKSFKDPVLNGAGRVAFLATIAGPGVTRGNDTVLVSDAFSGTLEVVAREGDLAPETGGAILRSFYSVSLQGGPVENAGLLFSASLLNGSGSPAVSRVNDFGAWLRTPSLGSSPRKVVREGDQGFTPGQTITGFKLLNALSTSPAQDRGHYSADGLHFTVSLNRGRQALVRFEEGELRAVNETYQQLGEFLPDTWWRSVGLPATDSSGEVSAVRAVYQSTAGGVAGTKTTAILLSQGYGEDYAPVVRLGDAPFGVTGATFSALKDPLVAGQNPSVAFVGTIKGTGVLPSNNTGIWWKNADGWQLVARKGAQAAEAEAGALWKSFTSVALPDGQTGPLFVASLLNGGTGVWGVDTQGEVRLLVRKGAAVGAKTLRSFSTLKATSGSLGVRRTFNNAGQLVYRAHFTDGSQGVVKVQVP